MLQRPNSSVGEKRDMRHGTTSGRRNGLTGGHYRTSQPGKNRQSHHHETTSHVASANHHGCRSFGNQRNYSTSPSSHSKHNQGQHVTIMGEPWYKHKTRPPITNEEKIKSEMCRNLLENGECPYGAGCRFAHHPSELKQIMRHPKHKTQLCRDYHGPTGQCTFGSRCSYIHEATTPKYIELMKTPTVNHKHSEPVDASLVLESKHLTGTSANILVGTNNHNLHVREDGMRHFWRRSLEDRGISDRDIEVMESLPLFLLIRLFRKATENSEALDRVHLLTDAHITSDQATWGTITRESGESLEDVSIIAPVLSEPLRFNDLRETTSPTVDYEANVKSCSLVVNTPKRPASENLKCLDRAYLSPVSPVNLTRGA
ncbi:hypothetical protein BIW11_01197 [Tropilaelaps mercedesae]|uniref:C3H1-type domain-containing protein n=1 Tax=Tropilaelaps mercedesae TaxID=418985 RepID=A0A1V9XI33_9ACAR|nr:hypothetical protein BIW11_01197 [Tropilaelaps mercedesae]